VSDAIWSGIFTAPAVPADWLGALLGAAALGVATEGAVLGWADVVSPPDEHAAAPRASKARPANDAISGTR
jgi:hypothetical protein